MTTVKIVPKTKRAKDRVQQHGDEMVLKRRGRFRGKPAILVVSQDKTWSGNQHWQGWFTEDEVEI